MPLIHSSNYNSFDLTWEASTEHFQQINNGLIMITYRQRIREGTFLYTIEEVRQYSCYGRTPCTYDGLSEELIELAQTYHDEGLMEDQVRFRLYRYTSNQMQGHLVLGNRVQLPHCIVE